MTLKKAREHQWEAHLASLTRFVSDNHRMPSSRSDLAPERSLATWVANQRRHHLDDADHLTAEQRKKLEAIDGWFWSADKAREKLGFPPQWKATYDELLEHLKSGEKMPTQTDPNPDVARLGRWIANQRRAYRVRHGVKKNLTLRPLSDKQIKLLDRVPMWSWPEIETESKGS